MTENYGFTKSSPDITGENKTHPSFDALKAIWREKVEASELFLQSELDHILTVWVQFVQNCLQAVSNADADEFYAEAAELAAQKLKHFPNQGWKCLTIEFPLEPVQCREESLDSVSLSTSTTESTLDFLGQVELLLQLVTSSNFSLILVKTALDSSFKPTLIELKSPQVFLRPKKYLDFEPEEMQAEKVKKDVLHGVYDEYILPLQIANEVDDEFWNRIENHTGE